MSTADSGNIGDLIPFPIEPGPGYRDAADFHQSGPSTMPWVSRFPFGEESGVLHPMRRVR
jgi:hypothetical protein